MIDGQENGFKTANTKLNWEKTSISYRANF